MPREPKSNFGYVCHDHAPKPNPEIAKRTPKSFIGKYLKLAFDAHNPRTGEPSKEHMWVKVSGIKDGKLVGILDNDPQYKMKLKCGDTVEFNLSEAEDFLD